MSQAKTKVPFSVMLAATLIVLNGVIAVAWRRRGPQAITGTSFPGRCSVFSGRASWAGD
ncbi:MAG TPA: hypothetical protein VM821_06110 [Abditibacteriaceae bacterium]|nr:hypothetical protein [Abditibacteriaceae bacterium]